MGNETIDPRGATGKSATAANVLVCYGENPPIGVVVERMPFACPFCGADPVDQFMGEHFDHERGAWASIHCPACGTLGPGRNAYPRDEDSDIEDGQLLVQAVYAAVDAWNERKTAGGAGAPQHTEALHEHTE